MEPVVSVRGLRKQYGDFEAVAGIDLEVGRGEIFAFLGPNGAGKTTTVEILEGFRTRTSGEVSVLGIDPSHGTATWRNRVGAVLQESNAEPGLTVREKSGADLPRRADGRVRPPGASHGVKLSSSYVAGIAALGVIAASFVNLVISITAQREGGILKRRRPTPVPAWAVVGSITFCVLAYALSTAIKNEDAAQPMVQAIMLPLYFISGVFIPNLNLPAWLRHVAQVSPVEHLSDGLHAAYAPGVHGVGIVWSDIGVLALWGAIGLAVALVRFSWLPQAASA